ncbi:MAG: hypothetical protein AAFQ82_07080 [Myxococcota bacterium]
MKRNLTATERMKQRDAWKRRGVRRAFEQGELRLSEIAREFGVSVARAREWAEGKA